MTLTWIDSKSRKELTRGKLKNSLPFCGFVDVALGCPHPDGVGLRGLDWSHERLHRPLAARSSFMRSTNQTGRPVERAHLPFRPLPSGLRLLYRKKGLEIPEA